MHHAVQGLEMAILGKVKVQFMVLRLRDSQTPGLPDSGTPGLPNSGTPGLPGSLWARKLQGWSAASQQWKIFSSDN